MRFLDVPLALAAALALAHPSALFAQAEPTAADALARARESERTRDFAAAARAYEEVKALAPSSRLARRADARLSWLAERRDPDGGYASLAALERMRRAEATPASLEAFERDVRAMPAGRARRESLFLLAETWHRRLADPARAIPFYEALRDAPDVTADERAIALVGLAEARAAAGERARGIEELEDAGLGGTFEASELKTAERRAALHTFALALLGLALLGLLGFGRPWRAGRAGVSALVRPARALAVAYVLGVPAAIAWLYASATVDTFLLLAVALVPVLALTSFAATALDARDAPLGPRLGVAVSVLASHVALFYLVLEHAGGLDGFGL